MSSKMDENKKKALESALQAIEKAFGKGSIMAMSGEADAVNAFQAARLVLTKLWAVAFLSVE